MSGYRIPEIARQYTHYDMIVNHTDLPDFPEYRTRLLYAFLAHEGANQHSSELFSLVASLLQLGMDTHDQVPVSNSIKEKTAARKRQLQVLAGDYFSALYYQLLSDTEHIELIRLLSASICEINRLKMSFYTRMKNGQMPEKDYIGYKIRMKKQLFLVFTEVLGDSHQQVWPEILELMTRCEVLLEEIWRLDSVDLFHESWGYWHIWNNSSKENRRNLQNRNWDQSKLRSLEQEYSLTANLYQQLEEAWKALVSMANLQLPEKLAGELLQIGEPFQVYMGQSKVLNEV